MEAKKTLLSTLMVSGLVLGGYAGLAHTQHQNFNSNFTAVAHADNTEGTVMKFSDGSSVVAKRDAQGNQVYDYVTKDGLTSQIPTSTNMTVADKGNDALVLSDNTGYTVVEPEGHIYTASSLQGMSKNIAELNKKPNYLYFGVAKYNTVGNTKIPVAFTQIVKNSEGKYYVQTDYAITTGQLTTRKDANGKEMSTWTAMGSPMTSALTGDADVSTADNGDVTIKFNPSDQGYSQFLEKQNGTYTNNLLSRGKKSSTTATNSANAPMNLSANEINTANDGKDKVSRVITYSIQTPDGLKQVGSYTYNGAENQFNADQVAQKNLPKGYKIVQMLAVPTVGADGSNDSNAFTYLVEKSSAASSSVTPAAASSSEAKASSAVASAVGNGNVSDVNHSSVSASLVKASDKSDATKDTAKNDSVAKSSVIASSSSTKTDAKDVSGAEKDSVKSSSVVNSSAKSQSENSKSSVSSKASSESALSKSSSSEVKSSMSESSKVSSSAESASSKLAESDKSSSVSNQDASSAVKSSSENVGSQSSSVIGQTDGNAGNNGGTSTMPEANAGNPGTTTSTTTSTSPADDTYSPQKAAMLAKTNAKAAQSGIIAAIGATIGAVAGWFGLKKKNN